MKRKSVFILILLCLITTTIFCEDTFQSDDGVSHLLAKSIGQQEIAIPLATLPPKNKNHQTEAIQYEGNFGWKPTPLRKKDIKPFSGTRSVPFPTTANPPTTRSTKGQGVQDSQRISGFKDLLSKEPPLKKFTSPEGIKNTPVTVTEEAKTSKEAVRMQPISASSAPAKPLANTDGDTRKQSKGDGGWKPSHMKVKVTESTRETTLSSVISNNHPVTKITEERELLDSRRTSNTIQVLRKEPLIDEFTTSTKIKNTPVKPTGKLKTSMRALKMQPTSASTAPATSFVNSDDDAEQKLPEPDLGRKPLLKRNIKRNKETRPYRKTAMPFVINKGHPIARGTKGNSPEEAQTASTMEYVLSNERSIDNVSPSGEIKNTRLTPSDSAKTAMKASTMQPTPSSTDRGKPIASSDTDTKENIPESKHGWKPTSVTDEQTKPTLDATWSSSSSITHLRVRNTKRHDRIDSRRNYGSERLSPLRRNLDRLVTFDGIKSLEETPEKTAMEGLRIHPQSASIASDKTPVNIEIDTPKHTHGKPGDSALKFPSPRGSRTTAEFAGATSSTTDDLFRTEAKDPLHQKVLPLEDEQPGTNRESERKRRSPGSDENSSSEHHEKHRFPPDGKPEVTERGGGTQHFRPKKKLSTISVEPKVVYSTGPRWRIALDSLNRDESGKGKHAKKKKKNKGHSRAKDPADSGSPVIVAGIFAGILILTFIITGLIRLWLKCSRRRTLSYGRLDDDYDDDDIVFERKQSGDQASHTSTTASSTNASSPPRTPPVSPAASLTFTDSPTSKQADHSVTVMTCTVNIPADAKESCSSCIVPISEISEPKFVHDVLPSSKESIPCSGVLPAEDETCPYDAKIRDPVNCVFLIPKVAREEFSYGIESDTTTLQQGRDDYPALVNSCVPSNEEQPNNCNVLIPEIALEIPTFEDVSSGLEKETKTSLQRIEELPSLVKSCVPSNEEQLNESYVLIPEIAQEIPTFEDVLPGKESVTTTSQKAKEESPVLVESCDPSNEEGKTHPNSVNPCTRSNEFQPVCTSLPGYSVNSSHEEVPLLGNDGHRTCSMESVSCIVPDPPVAPPISTATTALRQGKSHIGGKKALENRRYIKHFTSGKCNLYLKGQLDQAVARIFGHKKSLPDRNKEKRVVMRRVTQEAGRTMVERVVLAKEIILDEKRDKIYDLKSSEHRRVIRLGIVSTRGRRCSLQKLINVSRKVILSSGQERIADFSRKEGEYESKPSDSLTINASSYGSVVSPAASELPTSKDKPLDRAKSCIVYIPEEALEAHTYGEISSCSEADMHHISAEEKREESTVIVEPCVLSCEKEQLHACSENVCTKQDESKRVCASPSNHTCEKPNEEAPTVILDRHNACAVISMESAVPDPPVAPSISTATTVLREGKSQIGGKKAMENRQYVKHFTTGKYASNFKGQLDQAVTRILGRTKSLPDSNKEKRAVIKRLTREKGRTMVESILLAKEIILNEKVNKIVGMRSLENRRVIQRANGPSRDRRTSFEELINFSRNVIGSSGQERKAERRRKEMRKVVGVRLGQFYRPPFEIMLQIAGSTIRIDEQIRAVMQRNGRNHRVIRADAECLKGQGSIVRDISFVYKVICKPIIDDHEELPKPRCYCYRCLRLIDVKNLPKEWTQPRRKRGKRCSRKSTSAKPASKNK